MKNRYGWAALVASITLVFTLSNAARAQQDGGGRGAGAAAQPVAGGPGAAREPAPPLTRTLDGQPDLQGVWNNVNGTGISYENLELQAIEQQGHPDPALRGKSLVVGGTPDGKIPYQPWAQAKAKVLLDSHLNPTEETLDPQARCFLHGVPRQVMNREFEFFQPSGYFVIFNMAHHAYRIIPLTGGPQHIPDDVKLWMGDSRGHWEGNTLIVDVTNQNDQTWLDVVGGFHTDALHVVERFTVVDADTVDYEATLDDPKAYTKPWKFAFRFRKNRNYGELWEEACHEGNATHIELLLKRPGR